MTSISAAAVKALRQRTDLPMMDCKKALQEAGGDEEAAVELLRKAGKKFVGGRGDRETSCGRIAVHASMDGVGTIVELQCESAPVAANAEFIQLAEDLARQLATGPGAATPEELLQQPSPSKAPVTLKEQLDDLVNRIREVFNLKRIARIDAPCGGYVHHDACTGVLLEVEGGNAELAKYICMHVAAIKPTVVNKEALDPEVVAKEREILGEQARQEGKPENIIDKMVEGRLRSFYASQCLLEQPFVKGENDKETVAKVAKAADMKVVSFIHWKLGKE